MTDNAGTLSAALKALRRQWWIVALAVVVACAVAYFTTGDQPDVYVGKATVTLDLNIVRYPKMATVDDLVRRASNEEVVLAVASATGLDPEQVAGKLRATGMGNPQSSVDVTFEHADADIAKKAADAAATELYEYAASRAEPLVGSLRQQVKLSEELLARLEAQKAGMSAWEQTDIDLRIYQLKRDILTLGNQIRAYDAWSYSGEATVLLKLGGGARVRNLVGGAVAGLFLGLLVAAARESFLRRGAAA